MNCQHATALMSQGMDRALGTQERVNLRVHTLMCSGCRNYRQQLQVLRDAARQMAHGFVPLPDATDELNDGSGAGDQTEGPDKPV
jgi:predicted anti-sigma-YlaC factor YlaD